MRIVRVRFGGRRRWPLVAQRAGARARAQPRRHVQQAFKERRLLHHAPQSHTRPLHPHLRMLMSSDLLPTEDDRDLILTAKAYMSLRKHPIHRVHAGALSVFDMCLCHV